MGLEAITSEWFTAIEPIEERVMPREAPKHDYWGLTACSGVCYG
jgi:hypothetical protein